MKRLFDLALALILLVFALPICIAFAVLICVETPGSPLFIQTRVGRNERPFQIWKLRTMHGGTANVPTHQLSASAVTKLGAFLRATKIDELPQIWNVLAGDMSFVGPRPCTPVEGNRNVIAERRARGVFRVTPGLTGLAQVRRIDMSDPIRLAIADAAYVEVPSFRGDIAILLATLAGGGQGDTIHAAMA